MTARFATRSTRHGAACAVAACVLASVGLSRPLAAQHEHHTPAPASPVAVLTTPAAVHDHTATHDEGAMPTMSAHMRMTATRRATAVDSARARAVADTLKTAIAKYRDVRLAEKDGYELFLPGVKTQRVYHFTKKWNAVRNSVGFDASRPTSLLYQKDDAGKFVLIGAMYTAPKRLEEKDLDARVPLSIAQWHQHVDICVPKAGHRERWAEKRDGRMLFGPAGVISTEAECDRADGRFLPQLFGWMVHANVFTERDPIAAWKDDHRMDPSEMQGSGAGGLESSAAPHH